jgi:hypothetical protein
VRPETVKTYRCSAALSCSLTPSHQPSQVSLNKGHRASSVRTVALVYVWLQFTAPQSDRTEEPQPRPPVSCPRAQIAGEGLGKAGGADERHCGQVLTTNQRQRGCKAIKLLSRDGERNGGFESQMRGHVQGVVGGRRALTGQTIA